MSALFVCFIIRRMIKLFLILGVCFPIQGQVKWDGGGGDGLWITAANWVGNILPSAGDDVLFDHSILTGDYIVTLPSGVSTVTVKTLIISPAAAKKIEVVSPVSNI